MQIVPRDYRGRYSYRQEQRTPDTPNLAKIQVGYRVPGSAWGIVVGRSGSISTMLKPLQQGLMAVHLALEELALAHRIAAFEGNALIKDFGKLSRADFGDTSPVPRALIAGLQGMTCSRIMPTLEPMFEALMARPEEIKVLLLLHDGLAHDSDALASWARRVRCIAATLQAIRRHDYNALDPHATLVIVDQAITYLRTRRETLESRSPASNNSGLSWLLPTGEDRHGQPRYLYLIHPTQDPSTLLRTGLAPASGSTSAPTLRSRPRPWPALRPTRS